MMCNRLRSNCIELNRKFMSWFNKRKVRGISISFFRMVGRRKISKFSFWSKNLMS